MPRNQCCAPNCHNRGGFRFPTNIGLRKLWEAKVQRKDWTATKSSVLCRDHFDTSDIPHTTSTGLESMRRRLKKGAVPKYIQYPSVLPQLHGPTRSPDGPTRSILCGIKSGTQVSLSNGTNPDCGPPAGATTHHHHSINHRQENLNSSEPNMGHYEDMNAGTDALEHITIKEERLWDEDAEPEPMLEINMKKEFPTTMATCEVDGSAAVEIEQSNHVKREIAMGTKESEPIFGFVDVTASRAQLPSHSQVSDVDPLQLNGPVTPHGSVPEPRCVRQETPVAGRGVFLTYLESSVQESPAPSVPRPETTRVVTTSVSGGHPCATCGKEYRSVSSLKKHVFLHTAIKAHKCSECNAAFARPDYLLKHLLIHSGEKAWACERCDKTFTRNSSLTKHRRTHSHVKPFSCNECELSFTHRHQLARHLRSFRITPH